MASDTPIIVIGGGPAGAGVSALLARRGYAVILTDSGNIGECGGLASLLS